MDLITGDSDHSAGLMIDPKAIFRDLLLLAMMVTGSGGVAVGLMVTVFKTGKLKAAMIGFCSGLTAISWYCSQNMAAVRVGSKRLRVCAYGLIFPVTDPDYLLTCGIGRNRRDCISGSSKSK